MLVEVEFHTQSRCSPMPLKQFPISVKKKVFIPRLWARDKNENEILSHLQKGLQQKTELFSLIFQSCRVMEIDEHVFLLSHLTGNIYSREVHFFIFVLYCLRR